MFFFFFNDTATTEIYPFPLHARSSYLPTTNPTCRSPCWRLASSQPPVSSPSTGTSRSAAAPPSTHRSPERSEEHTSELQSRQYLVCRLLLEKKKQNCATTHSADL